MSWHTCQVSCDPLHANVECRKRIKYYHIFQKVLKFKFSLPYVDSARNKHSSEYKQAKNWSTGYWNNTHNFETILLTSHISVLHARQEKVVCFASVHPCLDLLHCIMGLKFSLKRVLPFFKILSHFPSFLLNTRKIQKCVFLLNYEVCQLIIVDQVLGYL